MAEAVRYVAKPETVKLTKEGVGILYKGGHLKNEVSVVIPWDVLPLLSFYRPIDNSGNWPYTEEEEAKIYKKARKVLKGICKELKEYI